MLSKKQLLVSLMAVLLLSLPINSYKCTHDDTEHPEPEIVDPQTDNLDSEGRLLADAEGRVLADATYPNMRIYANFDTLSTSNPTWNTYVKTALIPPIIDYFQGALRVKYPLGTWFSFGQSSACSIPTPADLRSGVQADLYWFITDAYAQGSWIADSYACNLMKASNRPYIGKTTINTYLFGATTDIMYHEKNIVCIMHEFTHVLGFSYSLYDNFRDANGNFLQGHMLSTVLNGYGAAVLNVEPLTTKLRAHFGCANLTGATMENTGGSGTIGSHFERRQFANEYMTSGMIFEMAVSEFSLALLEGSGWYVANYSYAEPHTFGLGQGCNFLTDDCSPTKYSEWCTGARACTTAGRGGGNCQADSRSDGCRFIHSSLNYHCENPTAVNYARFPSSEVYGRGANSKCFNGNLSPSGTTNLVDTSFCYTYTCVPPPVMSAGAAGAFGVRKTYRLLINVGSTSVVCNAEGPVSVAGYSGSIYCPNPQEYCTTVGSSDKCLRNCMGRGNCVNGVCQCKAGFTGADCALGPNGL